MKPICTDCMQISDCLEPIYQDISKSSYEPQDILWIKTIKSAKDACQAYETEPLAGPFLLNWSNSMRVASKTQNNGKYIDRSQKRNKINGCKNNGLHLTHLTTPINNKISEDDRTATHKWCRQVKITVKTDPITSIPKSSDLKFCTIGRGKVYHIKHIQGDSELTETGLQERIWSIFRGQS